MGEIAHVQRPVVNWARKQGILCTKFTPAGYRGYPDYEFLHAGKVVFIEFKDAGKELDPLQIIRIADLRARGFTVGVIDDKRDGIKFLQTHLLEPAGEKTPRQVARADTELANPRSERK